MKILIEHIGMKREINGSGFNICGSRADLFSIANQILNHADFSYGWIKIREGNQDEHFAGPNSKAHHWISEPPQ